MTKPKRPRDPNQLAKLIADIATGEVPERGAPTPPKAAPSKAAPSKSLLRRGNR